MPVDTIQGSEMPVSSSISVCNDKTILITAIKYPLDLVKAELYGCLAIIGEGLPLVKSSNTSFLLLLDNSVSDCSI